MKNWLNIALAAVFAIAATLIWVGARNRSGATPLVASATETTSTAVLPTLKIQVEALPSQQPLPTPAPAATVVAPAVPAARGPLPADAAAGNTRQSAPVAAAGEPRSAMPYTAQDGDTISKLAVEFFGSDNPSNEAKIISSNPSLQQQNPDRILAGQTYLIPARFPHADASTSASQSSAAAATQPSVAADVHHLRYSARPGDTVSILAGAFLGSDSNENRDTIIDANPSLTENPDRVLVGKTYQIPVQTGQPLAAAPSVAGQSPALPTTQPDADQLVVAGSTRELRYTAKSGDNVSTLAAALLGSDTKENRDAIVNSNPSLKQDPDRVLAGQTYWIPAPTASQP